MSREYTKDEQRTMTEQFGQHIWEVRNRKTLSWDPLDVGELTPKLGERWGLFGAIVTYSPERNRASVLSCGDSEERSECLKHPSSTSFFPRWRKIELDTDPR